MSAPTARSSRRQRDLVPAPGSLSHYERYKPKNKKRRDEFLSRPLFRRGSDVHTALNERSVMHEEIDAQRLRGHLKHGYEDPCLPIIEGTGRNEQAREQNCERYQVGQYSAEVKIWHGRLSRHQLKLD